MSDAPPFGFAFGSRSFTAPFFERFCDFLAGFFFTDYLLVRDADATHVATVVPDGPVPPTSILSGSYRGAGGPGGVSDSIRTRPPAPESTGDNRRPMADGAWPRLDPAGRPGRAATPRPASAGLPRAAPRARELPIPRPRSLPEAQLSASAPHVVAGIQVLEQDHVLSTGGLLLVRHLLLHVVTRALLVWNGRPVYLIQVGTYLLKLRLTLFATTGE